MNSPRTECDIAIRSMPEGRPTSVVMTAADLVGALAFSPDNRFLAIGGGDAQAIVVRDLQAGPDQPVIELKGPGTVVWNVAFADDNRPSLMRGNDRSRQPHGHGKGSTWSNVGSCRSRIPIDSSAPSRPTQAGPSSRIGESALRPQCCFRRWPAVPIPLDRNEDLRWTRFTFLPPNPGARHPSLAVAVGCMGGNIIIHRLPDGQRTRVFSGHARGNLRTGSLGRRAMAGHVLG